MKCNKCGSEWIVGKDASQTVKCPFCGADLKDKAAGQLTYDEAFKKIIEINGEDILNDRALFMSMLSDLVPKLKDEADITHAALGKNVGKILLDKSITPEARITAARQSLKMLSDESADKFLTAAAYGLGWGRDIVKKGSPEQTSVTNSRQNNFSRAQGPSSFANSSAGSTPNYGNQYQQTAPSAGNSFYPNNANTVQPNYPVQYKTYWKQMIGKFNNSGIGDKAKILLSLTIRMIIGIILIFLCFYYIESSLLAALFCILSGLFMMPVTFGKLKNHIPGFLHIVISLGFFLSAAYASVSANRNSLSVSSSPAASYETEVTAVTVSSAANTTAPETTTAATTTPVTTTSKKKKTTTTTTTTAKKKTTATTTAKKITTTTTTTAALISVPYEPRNYSNHPFKTMQVNITDNSMNWRIGPGYDYQKVDEAGVSKGEILDIYGEEIDETGETWGYVKRGEKWGWVTEKFLRNYGSSDTASYVAPARYYNENQPHFTVIVDGLRFRTGPSDTAEVIGEINSGTTLEEWGCNGDDEGKWVFTKYNGQFGWVMAYYGYSHQDPDFKYYIEFSGGMGKPVIYLYPTEKTDVNVELELLTSDMYVTYPNYGNSWNVTAYPDGRIVNKADGGTYDYLFWESVNSRTHYDMSEGFCVSADDTEKFLREKLEILGLNERERNEFIVYWLPIMKVNKYNYVTFQTECYTDAARLTITPKPDTLIRVYMAFLPLDEPVETNEPVLTTPERKGFTAVEWGGCEVK